jgi:diacylglycerol kinase (ATP)
MEWLTEERAHSFEPKRFNKLTYCEYCNKLIWGLVGKQGCCCNDCNFNVHFECRDLARKDCRYWERNNLKEHTYREKHFSKVTFCNVCRNILGGISDKQGESCETCRFVKHRECSATHGCPITSTPHKSEIKDIKHFWVAGNLKGDCGRCGVSNVVTSHLAGVKCFWCSKKLCSIACLDAFEAESQICDYGNFCNLTIPPTAFIIPQSDDISTWKLRRSLFSNKCPVIVFINKRSGGGKGEGFIRSFKKFLNPNQIFDLSNGGPEPGLQMMLRSKLKRFLVLACGGDGTVAWVLGILDKINPDTYPPIAVLPLGTGNDLSRSLGWGPGCDDVKEVKTKLLPGIQIAKVSELDRWKINITPNNSEEEQVNKVVNNYFSIGLDAKVALKFHEKREENPELFTSRGGNKLWYAKFGAQALINGVPNLHKKMEVTVDDELLDLPSIEALVIVNLPSCYGGCFLWKSDPPMRIDDGLFEIVGISNAVHLGQVQAGGSPIFIKQGKDIVIKFTEDFPVQIDGEPWNQNGATIHIYYHNKAKMLVKYKDAHSVVQKTSFEE